MKLVLKQKILTWFDSYNIYDEKDNIKYRVKGKLSWGHKLVIYDKNNKEIGTIKEKIITILPSFKMYIGNEQIGEIKKKISLFRPKFKLTCNDWKVKGDIWQWNYNVKSGNKLIMKTSKKIISLTDTYVMDIKDEEDELYCLMIVLAIDIAKCSKKKQENKNANVNE